MTYQHLSELDPIVYCDPENFRTVMDVSPAECKKAYILDAMVALIQGYAKERGEYVSLSEARKLAMEELCSD